MRQVGALVVLTASWLWLPPSWAAEPSVSGAFAHTAFLEANERYRAGRYDEAAEGYRALLEDGLEHPALYYNLGNALLKGGRKGEAVWAYLKARAFVPRDVDVEANLEYARSLLSAGEPISVEPPRLVRWLTLRGRFATGELAIAWVLLLWVSVVCWSVWAWVRRARAFVGPVAWSTSAAAVLLLVILVAQTFWVDSVARAVAVTDGAEVKFSPQEDGITHYALPEGTVVRLLQSQAGWAQIRRGDGRAGWVRELVIKPL